jgi:hypothetical protein
MKRLTTIICCIAMMFAGISAAFMDFSPPGGKTMMAATIQQPLVWQNNGKLPLDLQLDLDKRLSHESPTVDTVIVSDTVYVDKIKWKTRYKTVAARTIAREVGEHLAPVMPDSMSRAPAKDKSTLGREEQPNETVGTSKAPSIQLTVDGEVVYSRNDNHSTGESQ